MNDHSTTFEAVTSSMLKILKEDFSRTDSTLEGYAYMGTFEYSGD